jgi:GTP cyclohydrolase I
MYQKPMDIDTTEMYIRKMLVDGLGLNLENPNLKDTPRRIAKMYCRELFHNVGEEYPEEEFRSFPNEEKYDQIVMVDNIHFDSMCSHHFMPFSGKAWFLYQPDKKLMGVSKLPRIVEHYAARPQLQENLCHQILNRFVEVVQPKGVMLVMRAIHGCMSCRGVHQYNNTGMVSSAIYGSFHDPGTRAEGMSLIQLSSHL